MLQAAVSNTPGKGILVCQCYDQKSRFSRIHAQYPLKFVPTTGHADRLAVVYMLSYGGGIVSGDMFDVSVTVEPRAILLLMTQGNTKVFKDRADQQRWLATRTLKDTSKTPQHRLPSSLQVINAKVAASGATLLVMPDPVTSFRNSSFSSRQTFTLADDTSQLVLLDWFTSGRLSRGESWSFQHYSSRIDVKLGQKMVLRDHMVLDDDNFDPDNTSYAARLQPYTCFATLIVVSAPGEPLFEQSIKAIQAKADKERILSAARPRSLLWSSSVFLKGRGMLVRVAGMTTEQVRDFVKLECLGQGLSSLVGQGMFSKILM